MDKKDFLNELAQERWKEQYIKIDILNFSTEDLILSIEGYATSGNINLNGSSYIRRTATLSL